MTERKLHKPDWLKQRLSITEHLGNVRTAIRDLNLHTVCSEALCPNRNRCFNDGQATFLLMGDICTRNCRFCAVKHGVPESLDDSEPERVAQAAVDMKLNYVVVTSVTRDDIADGGASQFAQTIREIHRILPDVGIEVLIPDFCGQAGAIQNVLDEKPDVLNHNVETIPRLYGDIRPEADFKRSVGILKFAKEYSNSLTKSGFMVGLGETKEEVFELMNDLKSADIDIITIGQYLQPSQNHYPIERFVTPEEFDEYVHFGERELGISKVLAGPLVRSSYKAYEVWKALLA